MIEKVRTMKVKMIVDEDIVNYKKLSMFIAVPYCDGKCWKDLNKNGSIRYEPSICQNNPLLKEPDIIVNIDDIVKRYINNPLTHAVVFGGLEPCLSNDEVFEFIRTLRVDYRCNDDVVIYTGYNEDEEPIQELLATIDYYKFENIYVKFGRFVPGHEKHYDPILGVELASDTQYARRIY